MSETLHKLLNIFLFSSKKIILECKVNYKKRIFITLLQLYINIIRKFYYRRNVRMTYFITLAFAKNYIFQREAWNEFRK